MVNKKLKKSGIIKCSKAESQMKRSQLKTEQIFFLSTLKNKPKPTGMGVGGGGRLNIIRHPS